jgi:hypothetical protein
MKRRLFLPASVLLPLLLGLLLASGCSMDMSYDRYAVVYGISDYQGTLYDLDCSDEDAHSMKSLLEGQGYSVQERVDSAATRAQLESDIAEVAATATEQDLFLLYYSGHGGQGPANPQVGAETAAGSDSYEEWIFLWGSLVYTDNLPPGDGLEDYSTDLSQTVNDDELAALLRRIPCAKKVVLIDSCFSGGFIGNGLEADGLPPEYSGSMVSWLGDLGEAMRLYANFGARGQDYGSDIPPDEALVISACGEREVSWEPLHGHGVFTYFLLASATGGDANGDGYVTVSEAYDYIRRGINREWNAVYAPLHDSEVIFAPHVSGGPVDYVLFSSGD